MPLNEPVDPTIQEEVVTEEKFLANEVVFNIGDYPVKFWHLIVGLILLSIIVPMFGRRERK